MFSHVFLGHFLSCKQHTSAASYPKHAHSLLRPITYAPFHVYADPQHEQNVPGSTIAHAAPFSVLLSMVVSSGKRLSLLTQHMHRLGLDVPGSACVLVGFMLGDKAEAGAAMLLGAIDCPLCLPPPPPAAAAAAHGTASVSGDGSAECSGAGSSGGASISSTHACSSSGGGNALFGSIGGISLWASQAAVAPHTTFNVHKRLQASMAAYSQNEELQRAVQQAKDKLTSAAASAGLGSQALLAPQVCRALGSPKLLPLLSRFPDSALVMPTKVNMHSMLVAERGMEELGWKDWIK